MTEEDQAIGRWDRRAFEQVYRTYKDDMLTAAVFLLGGDRAAAEDVLHDVFIALAERAGEQKFRSSLRNYLLTSCLNRARDMLRRRGRETVSSNGLDCRRSDAADPLALASWNEESARLYEAMIALPIEQREVVTLHVHGQLKFREIAEMLELSINTVQSRYRYALQALRTMLAEKEEP